MTSKSTESGVSAINPVESPGRLLAAARESHSISPTDLAVRLRLDTKIIKALERDDFENLPAPTFVKGYIQSIAKELNVDSTVILNAYAAHASVEPPTLADFSSRAPDQVGVNSTIMKAVTYGLAATLIILMVLWWRSTYRREASDEAPALREEIAASTGAVPLPYSYTIVEHEEGGWRIPAPAEDPGNGAGGDAESSQIDELGTETPPIEATRLIISTTSEAWVEVYDASGDRLYFGMAKAEGPIELQGQPYYRLVLGNTDSISLRHGDTDVDLGPHSHEGVAQFELGMAPNSEDSAL